MSQLHEARGVLVAPRGTDAQQGALRAYVTAPLWVEMSPARGCHLRGFRYLVSDQVSPMVSGAPCYG